MVTKTFQKAKIIWQTADEDSVPDAAILVHEDSGGMICLEQEDACIVLNRGTIPDLIKTLKSM